MTRHPSRRAVLVGAAASGFAGLSLRLAAPARATPALMQQAIADFTKGAAIAEGGVTLDIPPLVENGNSVPLKITVDSPMTAERFIRRIAVFNERNPQPNVAIFHLGPRSGRAQVSTRIRLGDSQRIVAVAETQDGRFLSGAADLVVTLPACVEN